MVFALNPDEVRRGDWDVGTKGAALSLAAVGAVTELDGGQGPVDLKPHRAAEA